MNNIAVSVIVDVCSQENCLERCLDNLAYQTLENIEIILVDSCSSENAKKQMDSWQKRFSDKIQIINSEKNKSQIKNAGISVAKGQYITFVDSIDYFDYKMLEKLYNLAEKSEYPEMVYSPYYHVFKNEMTKRSTLVKHDIIEDYLQADAFTLPGKLLRLDLFERFGNFPNFTIEEDNSWLFPVISHLTEIVYLPTPLYYHESIYDTPWSDSLSKTNIEDIFKASERIRNLSNPVYLERALIYSLKRICQLLQTRPLYSDLFKRYLKDNAAVLDSISDLAEKEPELNGIISNIKSDFYEIPTTIYINGFNKQSENPQVYLSQQVFREKYNVVVLNNTTCELSACPSIVRQAYSDGNIEFVGHYFALKACYEQGGIYLDSDIVIEQPLNIVLNNSCFFGFETDDSFTDKIFGCCPGNTCFGKILQTYCTPSMYADIYAPLNNRIKTTLIGMYNIKMRSDYISVYEQGVCIYPVEMFVYNTPLSGDVHVCHYKSLENSSTSEIKLPLAIHTALWNRHTRNEVKKENAENLKRDREFLKNKVLRLETRTDSLSKDRTWLQELNARQKAKIEKLDNDCAWLQNQKSVLEKNQDWLQNQKSILEKNQDWLQNKVSLLETKKAGLEKDRDWLQNKVSLLETKKAGLEKDREWLQSKVSLLETKKAGLEKDRDWLQNKVSLLETKKASLEKDRDWLQNKNSILENRVEHLDASLTEYQNSRLARIGLKITKFFKKH